MAKKAADTSASSNSKAAKASKIEAVFNKNPELKNAVAQIEKAFGDVQGAYTIINQEFAKHNCQDYTYINREDDSGQEGLRKAKKSYNPAFQVEKYAAKLLD
jgi:hypothetical protein